MATVIIPMHTSRTRDCIVQDGVRYCESQPVTKGDGLLLGGGFLLWGALLYGAMKWEENGGPDGVVILALLAPFITAAIAGVIWGLS